MKVYDLVKKLLIDNPELRKSDKKLIWAFWRAQGIAKGYITEQEFIDKAELPESIRRARQLVMQNHPELRSIRNTKKESMKGMFAYHERTPIFDNTTNTVSFKYE